MVFGIIAPGAGHSALHDMIVTQDYYDTLPEIVRSTYESRSAFSKSAKAAAYTEPPMHHDANMITAAIKFLVIAFPSFGFIGT